MLKPRMSAKWGKADVAQVPRKGQLLTQCRHHAVPNRVWNFLRPAFCYGMVLPNPGVGEWRKPILQCENAKKSR
jgi:hypothetical protein